MTANDGRFRIAVVGGGFTGTLLAAHLMRDPRPDLAVMLIERQPRLGAGEAYRTRNPSHLLNVRAAGMSAFEDRPDDFVRWLDDRGAGIGPHGFAPRALYADYLHDRFSAAAAAAPSGRLDVRVATVLDIAMDGGAMRLSLSDGSDPTADAVALCLGNAPSGPVPGTAAGTADHPGWIADPWAEDAFAGVGPDDPVLVVGTGLSMVDAVLALDDAGHRGPVLALSRRGLHPRRHAATPSPPCAFDDAIGSAPSAVGLLGLVRRRVRDAAAAGEDWRPTIDGLRPVVPALWRAAPMSERARFLRHLRPMWDAHRHRIAPAAADRLDALQAAGRLRIAGGRILALAPRGADGFELVWRPRGTARPESGFPRVVVNATGPALALSAGAHPLLGVLARRGLVRPDPLGLGIETAEGCAVVDAAGRPSDRLLALGPLDRARTWETTAVPEIRRQVAAAAARLTRPR